MEKISQNTNKKIGPNMDVTSYLNLCYSRSINKNCYGAGIVAAKVLSRVFDSNTLKEQIKTIETDEYSFRKFSNGFFKGLKLFQQ